PISAITRKDVAPRLAAIRTNHSDNTCKQARRHLSKLFSWAMREGIAEQDSNPVTDTNEPKGTKPRERVLSGSETKTLWEACEGSKAGEFGHLVKLLLLTGCRREEIGELRWSWFAPDLTSFTVPKTKNGRAHTVPITPLMRSILDGIPRMV